MSSIETFTELKKEPNGRLLLSVDYNEMVSNLKTQTISNRSSNNRSKYLNFVILPLSHLALVVSKYSN